MIKLFFILKFIVICVSTSTFEWTFLWNNLQYFGVQTALVANIERFELNYYNPKIVTEPKVNAFFFNRTERMYNVTATLLVSLNSDNDYVGK